MDQANRIAYGAQRHKVITLNGELIDTSGAMTGGGRQKFQGKMGTQVILVYFTRSLSLCMYAAETASVGGGEI